MKVMYLCQHGSTYRLHSLLLSFIQRPPCLGRITPWIRAYAPSGYLGARQFIYNKLTEVWSGKTFWVKGVRSDFNFIISFWAWWVFVIVEINKYGIHYLVTNQAFNIRALQTWLLAKNRFELIFTHNKHNVTGARNKSAWECECNIHCTLSRKYSAAWGDWFMNKYVAEQRCVFSVT